MNLQERVGRFALRVWLIMACNPAAACVFCRRDLPHERHVTPLEYAKLFGEMEQYADNVRILDKPGVYGVGQVAAKERTVA